MDTKNKPDHFPLRGDEPDSPIPLVGPWLILSLSGTSVGMTDDFDTMMQFFVAGYEVR